MGQTPFELNPIILQEITPRMPHVVLLDTFLMLSSHRVSTTSLVFTLVTNEPMSENTLHMQMTLYVNQDLERHFLKYCLILYIFVLLLKRIIKKRISTRTSSDPPDITRICVAALTHHSTSPPDFYQKLAPENCQII